MDLGIKGKVALVVGASRSIGRAAAEELAREGCRLAIVARDAGALYQVAAGVGQDCLAIPADLMDPKQLEMALASVARDLGAPEIIVHAIGGSWGVKDSSLPASDWAKVWQLNLGIAIDVNRAFLPTMARRGWGRIVHVSSHATHRNIGHVPYTSAKHALEGYVKNLGREMARTGVVVSAIRPGPIFVEGRYLYAQTPEWTQDYQRNFVPAGRWGTAEEAAKAVTFLCSAGASYMAGSIVDVDAVAR